MHDVLSDRDPDAVDVFDCSYWTILDLNNLIFFHSQLLASSTFNLTYHSTFFLPLMRPKHIMVKRTYTTHFVFCEWEVNIFYVEDQSSNEEKNRIDLKHNVAENRNNSPKEKNNASDQIHQAPRLNSLEQWG